jgi:hypothetical protein
MSRGKQLQEVVAQLRAETGRNQNVAVGVSELDNLKEQIRRIQEMLYDEYDWPFLTVERSISLQAGQRFYDFPSDLNYDRINVVKFKYNNVYVEVERGITFDDYSIYDSTLGERSSPLLKWDVRNTGVIEQLEAWPIPNDDGSLHFFGTKKLSALVNDDDRLDLDDRMVVLFAAAEILARQKSPDARNKLDLANARLLKLRANSQAASKTIQVGLGNRHQNRHSGKTVIVVR